MKKILVLLLIGLGMIVLLNADDMPMTRDFKSLTGAAAPSEALNGANGFGDLPLYFIANKGQVNPQARFYARAAGYTLWLTKKGLIFDSIRKAEALSPNTHSYRDVSQLMFLGAESPVISGVEPTGHQVNIIKGKNNRRGVSGIPTSRAVLYKHLYKNIDLKVYGLQKCIEYDWIVYPGGNPANIRFQYQNVESTNIDGKGNIIIKTRTGSLTHKSPVCFQDIESKNGLQRVSVNVCFVKLDENTYGFDVDSYDRTRPLIIDPVVLAYSTFLGGSGDDYGYGLAVDGNGCAYVCGAADSSDFPTKAAYQGTYGTGERDAFVAKFSADGSSLVYSTYIGGNGNDSAEGIQVDAGGKAHIVGLTSSTNFPTASAYQGTYGGGDRDAFAAVLSADGSTLSYGTYLGGSGVDQAFAVALDNSGNIYVAGRTGSADFPTAKAYQSAMGGGSYDAFVAKFAAGGASLSYSTYLGGTGNDVAWGIAVGSNCAYVTGTTSSANFPTLNDYQETFGGGASDAFVTKLSTQGTALIFSTYLGGGAADNGYGIVVNSANEVIVTGDTGSTDFPTLNPHQLNLAGGTDAFVTKFNTAGTGLKFSTYLGGGETDAAAHVTVNNEGSIFVTGSTKSSDFPVNLAYQSTYQGNYDAFVSALSPGGSYISFSTFLGGGGSDSGKGIVTDADGNIYVAGNSGSNDFPTQAPFQGTHSGDVDAFVTKISTAGIGSICGAVDNCALTFTTGGDSDWFSQDNLSYYDSDALQSGSIEDGESTYFQTTVTGPGLLKFWWHVSSEYGDYLRFYIDGTAQSTIQGYWGSWEQKTYNISPGTHTLKWSYEKDYYWQYASDCGWVDKIEYITEGTLAISRDRLDYGAVVNAVTPAQSVTVSDSSGADIVQWQADANESWLSCHPASGTGLTEVSISVDPTGLAPGTYDGIVTFTSNNASNNLQELAVFLTVYPANGSSKPFGYYSTPVDGSTIRSNVPFTGWVLDDLGVTGVKIYRKEGSTRHFIGDAVMVEGARPDVAADYPGYPMNYKAGWGYMMLTNYLPNGGNGTFVIEAVATDVDGHTVSLGTKTVFVDNAHAVKPFGTIDTPAQGGTASGSAYINWGWALTPMPNTINNAWDINVWVDGVPIGHPNYFNYRKDIAELFPGYNNSNEAVGYYYLDTTAYENGIHNIAWSVRDNAGNTDGIGSRYFRILNSGSNRATAKSTAKGRSLLIPTPTTEALRRFQPDTLNPVGVITGYHLDEEQTEPKNIYPGTNGMVKIDLREMERVELHFDGTKELSGWVVADNGLKPLPIGSTLDTQKGIFYWQAGLGFVGHYRLLFLQKDESGETSVKTVMVNIKPLH